MPRFLESLARPGYAAILAMFTLDTVARAILITVVPLQAYALLADVQHVSLLYFAASAVGLCATLSVPWLVQALNRQGALAIGTGCLVLAVLCFSLEQLWALALGLVLQMYGGAAITICLNLYVLENISKFALTRFEPNRMLLAGIGWMAGPVLGVFLASHVAPWLPFLLSGGVSLLLLLYLQVIGGLAAPVNLDVVRARTNPARFIPRFFAQPRLALAWLLSVGRAAWWNMFYIYAPIYAVATGLGEEAGGVISSVGSAGLFTVMFWGWVGRRKGIRWVLVLGYAATAVTTALAGATMGWPLLGAALLVASAFAASIADGPGNVPFLRAVHPYERAEMTSVYSTYRESARLAMPAFNSVLLLLFPLPAVFVASGATMLALAQVARFLPRRFGRERPAADPTNPDPV
ncbi:MAG: MFS transporter [Alphaproteobacteria bacterium]|nr:MFS transporter [Alphaproteobacteria bacterium]